MSVSGFHHHFKAVTALSPLQFQKQLRLQEARRLMLGEDLDAASAAYRVGYHDASHFNREYKSLFGVPPMRDVQRLREEASAIQSMPSRWRLPVARQSLLSCRPYQGIRVGDRCRIVSIIGQHPNRSFAKRTVR
jgi:AraC-like DNA-binding protein